MTAIGKVLLKGLAVIVPIGVTLWVIYWLAAQAGNLLGAIIKWQWPVWADQHQWWAYPVLGIPVGLVIVFVVGLLTYSVIFRKLLELISRLLEKIPLIKSLYGGVRDLMDFASKTRGDSEMSEVVIAEPVDGWRILGFITRRDFHDLPEAMDRGENRVAVYIPMSYQIGGFTFFVPAERVERIDMSVEDAMRYALTAGMSTEKKTELLGSAGKREGESAQ